MESIKNIWLDKPRTIELSPVFEDLNKVLKFEGGNLYVLASRYGMGKTALVINIIYDIIKKQKQHILFISNEMSQRQIIRRFLALANGYALDEIDNLQADSKMLKDGLTRLEEVSSNLEIEKDLTFDSLRNKLMQYNTNEKIDFVVVDNIQRLIASIGGFFEASFEKLLNIAIKNLKEIAMEFKIPILITSEFKLNKKLIGDKRPYIEDMVNSEAIANDADALIFFHRPEYYGLTEDVEGNSLEGVGEIIIAKNRNGKTCDINVKINKDTLRIKRFTGRFVK